MTISISSFNARAINASPYSAYLDAGQRPLERVGAVVSHVTDGRFPRVVRTQPEARTVVVHIDIIANPSGALEDRIDELSGWLAVGTTGALVVSFNGVSRSVQATVQSVIPHDGAITLLTVVFYVPDPRWKSAATHTAPAGGVTMTGDLITDAVRSAAVEGDGAAAPDGSFGIFDGHTNLCTNGGFESNTTGWTTGGSNTIAQSSDQAKFGADSCKATYQNNATLASFAVTLTATAHWISAWIYLPADYNGDGVKINATNFAGSTVDQSAPANMATTGSWQRIIARVTPVGGDLVGEITIENTGTAPNAGRYLYIDGVSITAGAYPMPYAETDGGTAVQTVGVVKARAADIDETQGWVAARVTFPYSNISSSYPSAEAYLFGWQDDANNKIQLMHAASASPTFIARRKAAGAGSDATASYSIVAGTAAVVVMHWTSAHIKISVNGAAFTSISNSSIPALAATTFDIGGNGSATAQLNGRCSWLAAGTGTLTDADAATLSAFGATTPTDEDLLTASMSFVWSASQLVADEHSADVVNAGNVAEDEAIIRLVPHTQKAAASGNRWMREVVLVNRAPSSLVDYAVNVARDESASSDLDHAALVTAVKSQADGDDVRVLVDGVEVPRWAGGGGFNSTTLRLFINLTLSARRTAYLVDAIASASDPAAGGEIVVRRGDTNGWPSSGYLLVDTEAIRYSAIEQRGDRDVFVVQTRGARSTTAAAHSAAATLRWIEKRIQIVYGGTSLAAPKAQDERKPLLDLTNSTNTSHKWTSFYHPTLPRSMPWQLTQEHRDSTFERFYCDLSTVGGDGALTKVNIVAAQSAGSLFGTWADLIPGNVWARALPIPATNVTYSTQFAAIGGVNALLFEIIWEDERGNESLVEYGVVDTTSSSVAMSGCRKLKFYVRPYDVLQFPPLYAHSAFGYVANNQTLAAGAEASYPFTAPPARIGGVPVEEPGSDEIGPSIDRVLAFAQAASGTPDFRCWIALDDPENPGTLLLTTGGVTVALTTSLDERTLDFADAYVVPGQTYKVRFSNGDGAINETLGRYNIFSQDGTRGVMPRMRLQSRSLDPVPELVAIPNGNSCSLDDVIVTLDNTLTPYTVRGAETAVYQVAATITNDANDDSIALALYAKLDDIIEIDVGERTIENLTAGESVLFSATFGDADRWMLLESGSNRLSVVDTGQLDVDLDIIWRDVWA